MTTIAGASRNDDGWRVRPTHPNSPWGTGLRLERTEGAGSSMLAPTVAAAGLSAVGIGAWASGGPIGARLGSRGIGTGIGIAVGVAAILGAGLLMHRSTQNRPEEFVVHFATQPELEGVAPGDVYATLRAHHERHAPAIEAELEQLVTEGKVTSWSGVIGSNGFVVEAPHRHRAEVDARLRAHAEVGEIVESPL